MVPVGFVVMVLTILSMDLRISQATSRFTLDKPSPTAEYFQQWMIQYSKVYPNESEKQRRFEIFKNNLKYFEEFNSQGNHGYTLGVNQFTADVDIADIHTRLKAYEDVKKPLANRRKPRPTKLNPGSVLIILSGRFKGKRVVFLKQLPSGLLLVSGPINGFVPGPFKINGVPLRRVNQAYVIGTSTKLDIDGLKIEKNGVFWYLVLEKKKKDEDRKTVDV